MDLLKPRVGTSFTILNNRQIVFDNTKRLSRIAHRRHYYQRLVLSSLFRVRTVDMLRCHFPFLLPDMPRPAYLTLEFTNYCNLVCPYCSSPLRLRPQGMMSTEVFSRLLKQIKQLRVDRVRIVGNGEPTLHPHFDSMVRELAQVCKFLTIVTNATRLDRDRMINMLRSPLRLIEVSVDSNCKEEYERTRVGASWEKLLSNLKMLRQLRDELHAPALINVRAMIPPSGRATEFDVLQFWEPYGDSVIPQYLHDGRSVKSGDLFVHALPGRYPRCALPLKTFGVLWNGDVPLCDFSATQTGTPDGLRLGNVKEDTLQDLWNHATMKQYREGHRYRDVGKIPICQGCAGA